MLKNSNNERANEVISCILDKPGRGVLSMILRWKNEEREKFTRTGDSADVRSTGGFL
jgi:hypothetical protein